MFDTVVKVCLVGLLVFFVVKIKGCVDEHNDPAYIARQEKENAACRVPKLVTEKDGIKLWSVSEGCWDSHPVYFTSRGDASWDECWRSGKTTHCENRTTVAPQ